MDDNFSSGPWLRMNIAGLAASSSLRCSKAMFQHSEEHKCLQYITATFWCSREELKLTQTGGQTSPSMRDSSPAIRSWQKEEQMTFFCSLAVAMLFR